MDTDTIGLIITAIAWTGWFILQRVLAARDARRDGSASR